jgi:CheY-like chemotaxis protein
MSSADRVSKKAIEHLMDNITVLIVDDSSVMRKIVERSLRQAGIEIGQVFEAGNGLEALAVLNERKVNLVLCDINMPAVDGLEFVKQLPKVENAKGTFGWRARTCPLEPSIRACSGRISQCDVDGWTCRLAVWTANSALQQKVRCSDGYENAWCRRGGRYGTDGRCGW